MTSPHPSIEDVARLLALEHLSDDDMIEEIHWAPHPTEVRLVEITSSISDREEVLPFRFTPDPPDIPYPVVVVLLSPGDWSRRTEMAWPAGFDELRKIA